MIQEAKGIQIKDVVIPEPHGVVSEYQFDPKKDVPVQVRQRLSAQLEADVTQLDSRFFATDFTFAQRMIYYHLLFPEKLRGLISEERWVSIKEAYEDLLKGQHMADTLMIMKMAAPDRFSTSFGHERLSGPIWNAVQGGLNDQIYNPSEIEGLYGAIRTARAMQIYPKTKPNPYITDFPDKMYNSVVEQNEKETSVFGRREPIAMLADFRLAHEEGFQRLKKERSDILHRVREESQEKLAQPEEVSEEILLDTIGSLSIIGAKKIEFTDNGLQLVNFDTKSLSASLPLPEVKKF